MGMPGCFFFSLKPKIRRPHQATLLSQPEVSWWSHMARSEAFDGQRHGRNDERWLSFKFLSCSAAGAACAAKPVRAQPSSSLSPVLAPCAGSMPLVFRPLDIRFLTLLYVRAGPVGSCILLYPGRKLNMHTFEHIFSLRCHCFSVLYGQGRAS